MAEPVGGAGEAVALAWCKGCRHATRSVTCGRCGVPLAACAGCGRCPSCDGPVPDEPESPCDLRCGYVSSGRDLLEHMAWEHRACTECGAVPIGVSSVTHEPDCPRLQPGYVYPGPVPAEYDDYRKGGKAVSYIIIKVYNFECDWPGCRTSNIEVSPIWPATVAEALVILQETEHWTVKGGMQYCPEHTTED